MDSWEKALRVCRPQLPALEKLWPGLEDIWARGWVSNFGPVHEELERRLSARLGAPHLALTSTGTSALQLAAIALGLTGEVITTPFTFPATVNALRLAGATPVFCDIEPDTLMLDVAQIETAISGRTCGIAPVHLFGGAVRVDAIDSVAHRHGLRVLYDAAHAFGVTFQGRPITDFGHASALSFHATKIFHTIEGGAVAIGDPVTRARILSLRNHGIGPDGFDELGTNAKLNEIQALIGLLLLDVIDIEIAARREVDAHYRERLADRPGIRLMPPQPEVGRNYAFFPIQVDESGFGRDATATVAQMADQGIHARQYFPYLCRPEALKGRFPAAERAAATTICLPIDGTMTEADVERVCNELQPLAR
ncbi:MAG: DegT/DnrJ/EryC1/StrS family aminotransferase [Pseudomonadota bacterium]|nr:DegT/DnrJ/EryC1/StrS family aminotransferase [Pseudomonadota bacterium]